MSYTDFYNPRRVTLPFWAWGASYTIVPNRHIGMDIGYWNGQTETVPALQAGRVVRRRWTKAMGMCVVVQVGDRFHVYCHLANDRLPAEGTWLNRGDRVGRLAVGARSEDSVDFPGTAWGGIHLHLVITNYADAAYTFPRIRGSEFYDPAITVRDALAEAAGGGGRPFEPEKPKEWDEMASQAEIEASFRKVARELVGPDRRESAIIWVGQNAWVADYGTGTRYNAVQGHATVPDAIRFIEWLRDGLGWGEYKNQAPFTIAGLVDITNQKSIREEVAAGVKDAMAAKVSDKEKEG